MKTAIITLLFFLSVLGSKGQTTHVDSIRFQIDTLLYLHDSVFVKISKFRNENVVMTLSGYLINDFWMLRKGGRFRLIKKLLNIQERLNLVKVIKHGKRVEILKDGNRKVSEFEFDHKKSTRYYDADNREIGNPEPVPSTLVGPCVKELELWKSNGQLFFFEK